MKHEKHTPIQEGVMHGPHKVETSDAGETANKQRAAVREALTTGKIKEWQAKALREAINGYPEERRVEARTVEAQEIDELYNALTGLFDREKHLVSVKPGLGSMLVESIEVPDVDGKRLLIQRERPAYSDEPTLVAEEAPLSMDDKDGRNIVHTPVNVDIYSEDGTMLNQYVVTQSGNSGLGNYMNGSVDDLRRDEDEAGFHPSRHDIKALTANIDALTSNPEV